MQTLSKVVIFIFAMACFLWTIVALTSAVIIALREYHLWLPLSAIVTGLLFYALNKEVKWE